jgi:hypothetical protein
MYSKYSQLPWQSLFWPFPCKSAPLLGNWDGVGSFQPRQHLSALNNAAQKRNKNKDA